MLEDRKMAITHESVKCRETDEMWEQSPHQAFNREG